MPLPSFSIVSKVRGHHVYKDMWNAEEDIGEELRCKREPGNRNDTHAVAVMKADRGVSNKLKIL